MLAAVGDEHLRGADVVTGVALGLGGDGLAEFGQPGGGGVLVVLGLAAGGGGGFHDVVGRGEVGLTGAEADDVLARRLQRLGPCVDGQRGRLGDRRD